MEKISLYIDEEYSKDGLSHNGLLVTDYLPLKELIRRLTKFLNKKRLSDIVNNLDWLQNYK